MPQEIAQIESGRGEQQGLEYLSSRAAMVASLLLLLLSMQCVNHGLEQRGSSGSRRVSRGGVANGSLEPIQSQQRGQYQGSARRGGWLLVVVVVVAAGGGVHVVSVYLLPIIVTGSSPGNHLANPYEILIIFLVVGKQRFVVQAVLTKDKVVTLQGQLD